MDRSYFTKQWTMDQVILAPGSASLLIQHYRRREQDLLEANNRYLERARDAETRVNAAMQAIWPCRNDGGFDREIGPIGCSMGDHCVCAGVYPILVGDRAPTPPPSKHVAPDAAARLERILRLGRSMKWTPHGAPALDDEDTAVALGELFQIFFQDAVDRALATTEGSTDA